MIPQFPEFEVIQFKHKEIFEKYAQTVDTYSDFNFNSFWSWDTNGANCFSILNDNLVIKMGDYITGETIFSVLGENCVDDSIVELCVAARDQNINDTLKLVPRVVIDQISDKGKFDIQEDFDNHDYLFSISELAELKGNRFKSKRRAAIKCEESALVETKFDVSSKEWKDGILELLKNWESIKLSQNKEVDMEFERVAINRILDVVDSLSNMFLSIAVYRNEPIGFSVDEVLPNGYVLSHYFKTVPIIPGVSELLNKKVAEYLQARGCKIWNWEQDLGLETLRTMKMSHRPIGKQKKYTVSLLNSV